MVKDSKLETLLLFPFQMTEHLHMSLFSMSVHCICVHVILAARFRQTQITLNQVLYKHLPVSNGQCFLSKLRLNNM